MAENEGDTAKGPGGDEGFELLSAAPTAPDISGQLKPRSGAGLPKVTLALVGTVLAVGGFVGGIAVGKSSADSSNKNANSNAAGALSRARGQFGGTGGQNGGAAGGQNGQNGQFGRGGTVTGTVTAVSGSTLTITDSTGKQVTVDTTGQTTVTIGKSGALSDLANGEQVTVIGTPDSSGKITARSVLSGVSNFGGFGGTRGNRTPAPTPSTGSPSGSNG